MRYWKCVSTYGSFTVNKIYMSDDYGKNIVDDDGTPYNKHANNFIFTSFKEIKEGEVKMEDLRELIKPCYVVKMRDETWCVAIKEATDLGFYRISRTDMIGISSISSYNESLNNRNDDAYDIVEIREYVPCILFSYENAKLVWKREEKSPQQLEIESIEADMRKLANRLNELKEK